MIQNLAQLAQTKLIESLHGTKAPESSARTESELFNLLKRPGLSLNPISSPGENAQQDSKISKDNSKSAVTFNVFSEELVLVALSKKK